MKINGPLIPAIFLRRPNRFLIIVEINGKSYDSHLPDPGRLVELLKVGVKVYVRAEQPSASRKTCFTTVFVEHKNQFISLVTTLPNVFVKDFLFRKKLLIYQKLNLIQSEIKVNNHRIDFFIRG